MSFNTTMTRCVVILLASLSLLASASSMAVEGSEWRQQSARNPLLQSAVDEAVRRVRAACGEAYGITDRQQGSKWTSNFATGAQILRLRHSYEGIPVLDQGILMVVGKDEKIETRLGIERCWEHPPAKPVLSVDEAEGHIRSVMSSDHELRGIKFEEVAIKTYRLTRPRSVYVFRVKTTHPELESADWHYYVDATTGEILDRVELTVSSGIARGLSQYNRFASSCDSGDGSCHEITGMPVEYDAASSRWLLWDKYRNIQVYNGLNSSGKQDTTKPKEPAWNVVDANDPNQSAFWGASYWKGNAPWEAANDWLPSDGIFTPTVDTPVWRGLNAEADAYFAAIAAVDFAKQWSKDGIGRALELRVHDGEYSNAYATYDTGLLYFGDGKADVAATSYTHPFVVFHEIGHVFDYAHADFRKYASALGESSADIFGFLAQPYVSWNKRLHITSAHVLDPDTVDLYGSYSYVLGLGLYAGDQIYYIRNMGLPSMVPGDVDYYYDGIVGLDAHNATGPTNRAFYYLIEGIPPCQWNGTECANKLGSKYLPEGAPGLRDTEDQGKAFNVASGLYFTAMQETCHPDSQEAQNSPSMWQYWAKCWLDAAPRTGVSTKILQNVFTATGIFDSANTSVELIIDSGNVNNSGQYYGIIDLLEVWGSGYSDGNLTSVRLKLELTDEFLNRLIMVDSSSSDQINGQHAVRFDLSKIPSGHYNFRLTAKFVDKNGVSVNKQTIIPIETFSSMLDYDSITMEINADNDLVVELTYLSGKTPSPDPTDIFVFRSREGTGQVREHLWTIKSPQGSPHCDANGLCRVRYRLPDEALQPYSNTQTFNGTYLIEINLSAPDGTLLNPLLEADWTFYEDYSSSLSLEARAQSQDPLYVDELISINVSSATALVGINDAYKNGVLYTCHAAYGAGEFPYYESTVIDFSNYSMLLDLLKEMCDTSTPEQPFTIRAKIIDNANNETLGAPVELILDTVAPRVSLINEEQLDGVLTLEFKVDEQLSQGSQHTTSDHFNDGIQLRFETGGLGILVPCQFVSGETPGKPSICNVTYDVSSWASGPLSYEVTAVDRAGNMATPYHGIAHIDNTPPVVVSIETWLEDPAPGHYDGDERIYFSAVIEDEGSGLKDVKINGIDPLQVNPAVIISSTSYADKPDSVTIVGYLPDSDGIDGVRFFEFQMTDGAGNSDTAYERTPNYSYSGPYLSRNLRGKSYSDVWSSITIQPFAVDITAVPDEVKISARRSNESQEHVLGYCQTQGGRYYDFGYAYYPQKLDGYTIYCGNEIANDLNAFLGYAGWIDIIMRSYSVDGMSTVKIESIRVDKQSPKIGAPTVSFKNDGKEICFQVSVTDDSSGVKNVIYMIDDAASSNGMAATGSATDSWLTCLSASDLIGSIGVGEHTVMAGAYDKLDNFGSGAVSSFTLEKEAEPETNPVIIRVSESEPNNFPYPGSSTWDVAALPQDYTKYGAEIYFTGSFPNTNDPTDSIRVQTLTDLRATVFVVLKVSGNNFCSMMLYSGYAYCEDTSVIQYLWLKPSSTSSCEQTDSKCDLMVTLNNFNTTSLNGKSYELGIYAYPSQ